MKKLLSAAICSVLLSTAAIAGTPGQAVTLNPVLATTSGMAEEEIRKIAEPFEKGLAAGTLRMATDADIESIVATFLNQYPDKKEEKAMIHGGLAMLQDGILMVQGNFKLPKDLPYDSGIFVFIPKGTKAPAHSEHFEGRVVDLNKPIPCDQLIMCDSEEEND